MLFYIFCRIPKSHNSSTYITFNLICSNIKSLTSSSNILHDNRQKRQNGGSKSNTQSHFPNSVNFFR